jgi:hypothetical protein
MMGVRRQEPVHPAAKIVAPGRTDDQVKVIRHQAGCENL